MNESSTGEIVPWAEEVCMEEYSTSGKYSSQCINNLVLERLMDSYDELLLSEMEKSSYATECTGNEHPLDPAWNVKEYESRRMLKLFHAL